MQLVGHCTECLVYWLYSYISQMTICFVSKDSQMNCTVSKGRHRNTTPRLEHRATLNTDNRLLTSHVQLLFIFTLKKKKISDQQAPITRNC